MNTPHATGNVRALGAVPKSGRKGTETRLQLVPSKGLEPPHPCGYMDLNHARLPIPPRWPKETGSGDGCGRLPGKDYE